MRTRWLCGLLAAAVAAAAASAGPPQPRIEILASQSLDWLTEDITWENSGGPEGAVAVAPEDARVGTKAIRFRVNVDWYNEGKYPQGWPSFQFRPPKPLDLSGYDLISFWVRATSTRPEGRPIFRFILHTAGELRINRPIAGLTWNQWHRATFDLSRVPRLNEVTLIHFYICESDYAHGDRLEFVVDGFELAKLRRGPAECPPNRCAVEMRILPERRAKIISPGEAPTAVLRVYSGSQCSLGEDCKLAWRAREIFSQAERHTQTPLPAAPGAGETKDLTVEVPAQQLLRQPGYYLITCDIVRDGQSLTGGWVGSDDVYVRAPGESMTQTVLGLR
ncbi:MAG: hypothetical protein H5T86_15530, partial [Armatimonadetes bacterium]|nr:hypothetical protein [Armatimonadota bacterium]